MKRIAILGSTGSIGTQTLEVVENNQDIQVTALAAGSNIRLLEEQIRKFHPTLACAIAAVISQIGDLAASAIKRNHDIKDYGNLIPGHGGILDRFDSMLFTAPAIFFALLFLP